MLCGMQLKTWDFALSHNDSRNWHWKGCVLDYHDTCYHTIYTSLIANFMGPAWGPYGADRTQVGPMLAPLTLLSGMWTPRLHWMPCGWPPSWLVLSLISAFEIGASSGNSPQYTHDKTFHTVDIQIKFWSWNTHAYPQGNLLFTCNFCQLYNQHRTLAKFSICSSGLTYFLMASNVLFVSSILHFLIFMYTFPFSRWWVLMINIISIIAIYCI